MKKIIKNGLYILVFLLPLQTRWIIRSGAINGGYFEYGTISLYATDILLVFLLFSFVFIKWLKPARQDEIAKAGYASKYIWFFIIGFLFFVFISIFSAQDKLVAFYGIIKVFLGVGFFWLITQADYNRLKLVYFFLAGALIQSALGIWQFLTQKTFLSKWLGIAWHHSSDLGASVIETLSGERWLRAYGGLDHPNMLGGFLTISALIVVFLIIERERKIGLVGGESRENKTNIEITEGLVIFGKKIGRDRQRIFQTLILYLFLFVFFTALFFTFSRGAWAGLIVGLIASLFILAIKKDFLRQKKMLKIIFMVSVLIFILFSFYSDLVLTRLSQDTRLEVKSNKERIQSFKEAAVIIKNHWFLGVGVSNYPQTFYKEIDSRQPSYTYQPVHNTFLLVWAETGLFGLLFFILIILHILFISKKGQTQNYEQQIAKIECQTKNNQELKINFEPQAKNKATAQVQCLFFITKTINKLDYKLPVLSAVITMFFVDHWWWSLNFGIFLFWFICGLTVKRFWMV